MLRKHLLPRPKPTGPSPGSKRDRIPGVLWRLAAIAGLLFSAGAAWAGDELLSGAAQRYDCVYRVAEPRIWLANSQGVETLPTPLPTPLPAPDAGPSIGVLPSPATPPASGLPFDVPATLFHRAMGNTWYVRVDYFQWSETTDALRILRETGPLVTLGFLRQGADSRLRAELFGGSIRYDGQTMDGDPLKADTGYLGFRAEYDLLWALQQDPNSALVMRLGTRLWNRALGNSTTESGIPVIGYDETWWTVYPCLGLETRRPLGLTSQWFATACLGVTAFTYEAVPAFHANLFPKPGPLVQVELGIRTPRLLVSGFLEMTQWFASDTSNDVFQPDSMMLTAGLTGGLRF